jgi:hypothetical protein
MQSIVDVLRAAIAHHQASNHAEAEALYRTVLDMAAGHPPALYLYGLLLLDTGRSHEAVAVLEVAAASRPGHAGTLTNLIRALLADRRPAEALAMTSSCPPGSGGSGMTGSAATSSICQDHNGTAAIPRAVRSWSTRSRVSATRSSSLATCR